MEKIKQTAGRDQLGSFAPLFAHLNDDVLFGEVWNDDSIDIKTRCIITVVALMASGVTDSSLEYNLENAKNHGVSKKEIAAVITHTAMYTGWPKGWAVFRMAKKVWAEDIPDGSFSEKPEDKGTETDAAELYRRALEAYEKGEPIFTYLEEMSRDDAFRIIERSVADERFTEEYYDYLDDKGFVEIAEMLLK